MKKNLKKKKKGFTLVEVIIVLAIIAIIAAIAIPNLTKVRQQSKIKADRQSVETLERTINMLITDGTIPFSGSEIVFTMTDAGSITASGVASTVIDEVKSYLDGTKKPQEEGKIGYEIKITASGTVEAKTTE